MYQKVWQLQDAKARFSEFLREAIFSPQAVSVRGETKAVMVSLNYFKEMNLIKEKSSLENLIKTLPVKI